MPEAKKIKPKHKKDSKKKKNDKENSQEEIKVDVTTIATFTDLKKLINSLSGVNLVGCYLAGVKGRFGSCSFIALNIKGNLYAIDVEKLEGTISADLNFWEIVGSRLFGNRRIVKVCFECKDMVDYLYHRHGITVKNVFDLKEVARKHLEKKLRFKKKNHQETEAKEQNRIDKTVYTLYQLYKVFLPNLVSDLELKVLLEFLISPEFRLEGVETLQSAFLGLQVKYLFLLKRDLEIREEKFFEDLFKKRFKQICDGTDDRALEFFRKASLQGINLE